MLNKIIEDCKNCNLPKSIDNFNKMHCSDFENGMRIAWYYKEDLRYAQEGGYDPKTLMVYSGIIIGVPDTEYNGSLEPEDCIVVIDEYPCEKCYPLIDWISLNKLLDNEDLIEIYEPIKKEKYKL